MLRRLLVFFVLLAALLVVPGCLSTTTIKPGVSDLSKDVDQQNNQGSKSRKYTIIITRGDIYNIKETSNDK